MFMDKIENLQQFEEAVQKVEELLPLISDDMPTDDPNYIEFVRLSNMVADYDEVHFSLCRSFDEVLDAKYGKVGTPEREQFRKEVEAYRQAIEEVDKKLGLEKLETEEQYQWAINRIEELRPLITNDTPCYDHNSVEKELLSFMIMDYEEELCPQLNKADYGDLDKISEQDCLEYKGYKGTIEYSNEDDCLFGKVLGLGNDLITYEGQTVPELRCDFEEAINSYLEMKREDEYCQEPKKAREGWSEAFAKYAEEGEDEQMLPDCVDWEKLED